MDILKKGERDHMFIFLLLLESCTRYWVSFIISVPFIWPDPVAQYAIGLVENNLDITWPPLGSFQLSLTLVQVTMGTFLSKI